MYSRLSDREYTVYMHISPNNKKYIGITCQSPQQRWGSNRVGYKSNSYFWNSIQKYGWSNFKHFIIKKGLTQEEASELEKELIKKYKTYTQRQKKD